MENKFGVDVKFFKKEFRLLSQKLNTSTPEELSGSLMLLLEVTKKEIKEGIQKGTNCFCYAEKSSPRLTSGFSPTRFIKLIVTGVLIFIFCAPTTTHVLNPARNSIKVCLKCGVPVKDKNITRILIKEEIECRGEKLKDKCNGVVIITPAHYYCQCRKCLFSWTESLK